MAKKRHSSRPRKTKGKSSNGVVGAITVIAIVLAVVLFIWYMRQGQGELPLRPGFTQQHDGKTIATHIDDLDVARTPDGRKAKLIRHLGYNVSYNSRWRLPNWVAYELTADETRGDVERTNNFMPDPDADSTCPRHSDYTHSGYDRGHMAPAADMAWSRQAMEESFYMTNICPQVHALNAGVWNSLEDRVRSWARRDSAIIVASGPIVGEKPVTIGRARVAVPDAFFKVVASPYITQPRGIAFVFPNEDTDNPLYTYAVTIDSVETLTGIDFLYNLPDSIETHIEQNIDLISWQL